MGSWEFEGRTYEDALNKAVMETGLKEDQMTVEVMKEPDGGFFSLKRKKFLIRVTPVEVMGESDLSKLYDWMESFDVPSERANQSLESELTGKAWIKSGELLFSSDDVSQPTVVIPEELVMYINGEPISGSVLLQNGDHIRFDLPTVKKESVWTIKVDESSQQVVLTVEPGKLLVPFLEDHKPVETLPVSVGYFDQPDNELTEEDIYSELSTLGIVFGIDDRAIERACRSLERGEFVIAEGKRPVDGQDAELSMDVELDQRRFVNTEDNEGNIDFKDSLQIPAVREGDRLGQVIEETEGIDGVSVRGDVLKAADGVPIDIKSSEDVRLSEDLSMYALVAGRPQVEKSGNIYRIVIAPKHTHKGDLSAKDGHIRFAGDVEVTGFVMDGMKVSAEGTVFIHKGTLHSQVYARESVIIGKNVINSTIVAGKNSVILQSLSEFLGRFMNDFDAFVKALHQLKEVPEFRAYFDDQSKVGSLVQKVKESRFPEIEENGLNLVSFITENRERLESDWLHFVHSLERYFLSFRLQKHYSLDALEDIHTKGQELLEICRSPGSQQADISLHYAMNSKLEASHDVRVIGKGLTHSDVLSGGHVSSDGKITGGKIKSVTMDLHTVGSPSGVKTVLQADDAGFIRATQVFPDVLLRIGNRQHFFDREESMIYARLDEDGELHLH
ncbi:flagellar assembly protein A [Salisediminibacterium selenitireducens]|uniref:RNA-binding protein KhpB N-terminal domain-containing protein n=1 Tax=Bacillus selenitireducens (strain ATCC 700615 / DSM 15326 / MLS10) TaxID=439292 RepID=D6XUP2_BACIE|nr:FapA family protein [Salisediminibacterium selenitireducens]ADH99528.1 protein of unknown function DUF342 [[Bacillus] selenitireducens MLS10]